MTGRRVVCVYGAGNADKDSPEYATAVKVGSVLASLGHDVANGGYGGTMEAVSRGAKAAGATVIGVTCRIWSSRPNAFVDEVIETRNLYERLRTLIELGAAGYVVLPGATGTLLELAGVWEVAGKESSAVRPVVCVGDYWRSLVALIERSKPAAAGRITFAASPEELDEHFQTR